MIKKISIQYIKPDMLVKIKDALLEEPFVEDIKVDEENGIFEIYYLETKDNKFGISLFSAISISLALDYIHYYSKYKNKEKETQILTTAILKDSYFANTLLIELLGYFQNNSLLKEKIFFQFNMKGFEEELHEIIEDYNFDSMIKKATNEMQNMLKQNGINFNDYSTLEMVFDEDECFSLKNKKGQLINPSNIQDILFLTVDFPEQEDDLIEIVAFCTLLVSILNVKTLVIPEDEKEIIQCLSEQDIIIEYGVKLVLK